MGRLEASGADLIPAGMIWGLEGYTKRLIRGLIRRLGDPKLGLRVLI